MSSDTPSTLVSIPNCTAAHVLGGASIPLTSGTLSLTKYASARAAQAPDPHAAHTTASASDQRASAAGPGPPPPPVPVLTLQIGKLAFPLMKDTLFGTDATASRVYLFVPELELGALGEEVGSGHIRLELPPQAEMTGPGPDGESLKSLQDAFEQTLVGEGLLKEGWRRGVKSTVDGLRDKVAGQLATESGRVPPEAIGAD
ncbi:hypothetical protein JB92DRAFT_2873909 [Gautieria morchelliformis]|nr:hypothetical protein JB92DRAFT_2873909 [Gautieria morchelliformis]